MILASHHKWVPLLVVALAAAAIDVIYMIPRESLIPAKFLIPGTVFLIAFHDHPDRLHDQHRLHELLDGAHSVEERGNRSLSS